MPRIRGTSASRADVVDILVYLRARSPQAARRVQLAINSTLSFLAANPGAGQRRLELAPNLRSFPIDRYRTYLILYIPLPDGIQVVRVVHGARDLGALFRIE